MMIGNDGEVKLIDFGLSLIREGQNNKLRSAGSPYYFAPEVFDGIYGNKCDIWSLGVSFFEMLSNKPDQNCYPFPANSFDELKHKVKKGAFKTLKHLSHECQDLLK